MAETLTDKLKLSKRDTGDINWGQGANANLDAVDIHAQQGTLRPPRTLLASLGSGAVGPNLTGNTTFFYKVTAINAAGETTEGKIPSVVEAQVTESAAPVPIILSWETVKGATGYKIYKSTLSGQEKFLAQVAGEATATYTDDGNTVTNPGVSVPTVNTATTSVSKITAGTGVSVNPAHGTGDVQVGNAGVTGVRKLGEAAPLAGDVKLEAGANIALTQDGIANKIVIAATGAGPAGYATVVVAAPTGVAATDRANIQNAINGLPAAGGTVILREGNYVLDNGISFPVGKPVALIGQGPSTSISLTTLFEDTFPAVFVSAGGGNLERIVLGDFRFAGATRKALFIAFSAAAGQVFSDLVMRNLLIVNAAQGITLNATGVGGRIQNVTISDCHFVDPSASVITGQSTGGVITGVTISGTHTRKASGIAGFAMFIEGTKINFLNNYIEDQGFGGGLNLSGIGLTDSVIDGNAISAFICINIPTGATNFIRNTVISNNSLVVTGGGTLAMRAIGELSNSAIIGNRASHPIQLDVNAASLGNVIVANKATITDNSGQSNIVAQNFVSGLRKLGEASALTGDVKLEAGSGIALTQDAPNNKITIAAAGGGNWSLVANLVNTTFGQTFAPDFTGLSLATHRSYMLMFELSLSSGGAGPNFVALRLNGLAPTTLQQYMLTDQQGATQDNEGSANAMAKILKVFPGGGSSVEVSGCIIITGKVNSGFPHAVGWYTVTNQSVVEQMHRGNVGLRMNLGSGVDLTSLGLFSNLDLNFLVAGSCRMSLYRAQ